MAGHGPDNWAAGQEFEIDGLKFRVETGEKEDGDLVVQWLTPNGWRIPTMRVLFVLVSFMCTNEDWLTQYRPHWREAGGDWLMGELYSARHQGWRVPWVRIEAARLRRRERGV